LLDTRAERVVGVQQVVSDLDVTNSVIAGEIAVLQSNLLIGQVVDELGLVTHPEFDPARLVRPGLFARLTGRGGAGPQALADGAPATGGSLTPEQARHLVIWQVRRNLNIYQSGISYVIAITMRAEDPQIAADIANAIAGRYIADQLEAKQIATQRAISWLDNRLNDLQQQLRDAEDAVVDFTARQIREEGGDAQGISQQLAQMNIAIVTARNDRAAAESRLRYIRDLLAREGPQAAAAGLSTPRLTNLDAELAERTRQRAQLAMRLGPQHPEMRALELALSDLERDRAAAIQAGVDELVAAVAEARGREDAIQTDITAAQQLQVELSRSRVRLSQLERSASAMRQVYESFLARFQETAQQLEFQRADARVISEAEPAMSPARPRRKLVLAVGLALGAMLGMAAALARAALDPSVRGAGALARLSHLPVLARLPRLKGAGRDPGWQAHALRNPGSGPGPDAYAEGLRCLRLALMRDAAPGAGGGHRVILVTGADWGAGSSATVAGLARVMSDIGLNVAVFDANLRRPALAGLLGARAGSPGLEDYLRGAARLDEIIIPELEPNLSLLPARANPGRAADLIAAPGMRVLIDELAVGHDVVLIDAPPAAGLADTARLAELADAVVLVVRDHATSEAAILDALALLNAAGGNVLGTVLSHDETAATGLRHRPAPRQGGAHGG
ncbi:MAG: GNVR domain-containing protein, partial [Paracoccus sp. (in: a-proteobacteria)]|nr:GNVR domain-containing protein [Paracoccus sp. (in: a-proteobacteria)]